MFISITLVIYLLMLLVRGTLPRYRIDMLISFVWKAQLHLVVICLMIVLIPPIFLL